MKGRGRGGKGEGQNKELLRLEIRNGYVSGTVTVLKQTQCVVCTNARLMHTLGFRRRCVFLFTRIKHVFKPSPEIGGMRTC